MKYGVYAIKDNLSEFMAPTIDFNDNTAKRNFALILQNSDGVLHANPGDYDLYKIAEYDASTGALSPLAFLEFVAHGKDMINA